ncbi:hypothetical protein GCM10028862_16780 [Luteimonas pelagia]
MTVRACTRAEVAATLSQRRSVLAERGQRLAGMFAELGARPHPDKADMLLRELHEARTAVARMRDDLLRQRPTQG